MKIKVLREEKIKGHKTFDELPDFMKKGDWGFLWRD